MISDRNVQKGKGYHFHIFIPRLLNTFLTLVLLVGIFGTVPAQAQEGITPESNEDILAANTQDESMLQTNQVIIKYKDQAFVKPASDKQMQRIIDKAGIKMNYLRKMSGDAHVLGLESKLPDVAVQAIIKKIQELPEVEYAEPDLILQHTLIPNDPQYPNQWHYFTPTAGNYGINAPEGWDVSTGSVGTVVAVVDTGITSHAEFAGKTVPGYDFISDTWTANDSDGRESDPSDPGDWVARNDCGPGYSARNSSWHGTHVAGTIGALSNNSIGVAGINWNAKILPVRVLGRCGGYTSDIADGIRWAAGVSVSGVPANVNPADVINISLGGLSSTCGTTFQTAITAAINTGTTVVTAAGNNNIDVSGFTPANCTGNIAVSATDQNGSKASYSNFGTGVEISAPGNGVISTLNTGTTVPLADSYASYSGTSMATPHVVGVASMLYSLNPSISPADVKQILQETATLFPSGSTCTTSLCGTGIVNMGAAMDTMPTAVDLLYFTATGTKRAITLDWETATEVDNLGFNLYRAASSTGVRTRINSELIPGEVPPGSNYGAVYAYTDTTVRVNKLYYYWLEDVDIYEHRTLHGPVTARALAK